MDVFSNAGYGPVVLAQQRKRKMRDDHHDRDELGTWGFNHRKRAKVEHPCWCCEWQSIPWTKNAALCYLQLKQHPLTSEHVLICDQCKPPAIHELMCRIIIIQQLLLVQSDDPFHHQAAIAFFKQPWQGASRLDQRFVFGFLLQNWPDVHHKYVGNQYSTLFPFWSLCKTLFHTQFQAFDLTPLVQLASADKVAFPRSARFWQSACTLRLLQR